MRIIKQKILRLFPFWIVFLCSLSVVIGISCSRNSLPLQPSNYLLITHSALNRITIFDLATNKIVGALPTHKLPHDMLLSNDKILFVVNTGSQCFTTYDIRRPEFWTYAQEFIQKDSVNLYRKKVSPSKMMEENHPSVLSSDIDTAARTNLNRDPVQLLPSSFAHTYLTDPHFPDAAKSMHEKVQAFSHTACYDCHDRSIGAKPFGLTYTKDSTEIFIVHLRNRDITFFDTKTLTIKRKVPLQLPEKYSPIEAWIAPDENTCFVTCRNEIGESKQGCILVINVSDGALLKSITAGIYPWHIMADPGGKKLYVNNFQSSRISVIDVAKREIIDSLIVQNGPSMMRLLPEENTLVVSCFYTDKVLFVDLASKEVKKIIGVDSNPTTIEFSSDKKTMYVLCGGESSLNIINVSEGTVKERHKLLFGAYAFLSVHN